MNSIKKNWLLSVLPILIVFIFCLTACAAETENIDADTPEQAVHYAMEALEELDLDTFNAVTDNYVRTYRNWIGIPTEKEYRIFNELQQPGLKGKRYKTKKAFADQIVQNLSWEIKDIREDGEKAQIDMTVTNIDMSDVMGMYEIHIMENMLNSEGTGLASMIRDLSKLDYNQEEIISLMQKERGVSVLDITAEAFRDEGSWKIHVSDSFANAVMGNMDSEFYSDEIQNRLDELERQYEHKMDKWGDEFEDKIESWGENLYE